MQELVIKKESVCHNKSSVLSPSSYEPRSAFFAQDSEGVIKQATKDKHVTEALSNELFVGDEDEVASERTPLLEAADFEKVYRVLIEQAWQSDPVFRPDATNMREILERTTVL